MVKIKNKKSKTKNNGINLSSKEKNCIKMLREVLKKDLSNELINNICDDILNTTEENITIFKNDFNSRRKNFDNAFNELYSLKKITSLDDLNNINAAINLLNAIIPTSELLVKSIFNDAIEYLDEIIADIYNDYAEKIVGLRIENDIVVLINKELKKFRNSIINIINPLLDDIFDDFKKFSEHISHFDLNDINDCLENKNKIEELLEIKLAISDTPLKITLVEGFIVEVNSVSIQSKANFKVAYDTIANMENELKEKSNSIFADHDIIVKNNSVDGDFKVELQNDNSIKIKMNNSSGDKNYSWQELNAIAIKNGFIKDRIKGDHGVFKKRFVDSRGIEQERVVVVPQGRTVGLGLQKRILKDLGILR